MSIFDVLTSDLNWRESELASLKILLRRNDITRTQRETLLRAAWAMLYAHYEGFSKFCLTAYYDEVSKRLSSYEQLPSSTKIFALEQKIKELKNMAAVDFMAEIESFLGFVKLNRPNFPEIDTKSNLWPNVMLDLLRVADIGCGVVDFHTAKLSTLVARRNDIAHGKRNFIAEVDYYLTYENVVYEVMYDLAYSIDDRLSKAPYVEANSTNLLY